MPRKKQLPENVRIYRVTLEYYDPETEEWLHNDSAVNVFTNGAAEEAISGALEYKRLYSKAKGKYRAEHVELLAEAHWATDALGPGGDGMGSVMREPAWRRRLYAKMWGYFWLPCPICGDHFGGQEVADSHVALMDSWSHGRCICPKPECQREARNRNAVTLAGRPY